MLDDKDEFEPGWQVRYHELMHRVVQASFDVKARVRLLIQSPYYGEIACVLAAQRTSRTTPKQD